MPETEEKQAQPPHQDQQPGRESEMTPRPAFIRDSDKGSGKLAGQILHPNGGEIVNG